jgi:alcohol dehydrogenase
VKAVVQTGYGDNRVVEVRDFPKPEVGRHDVLIEVIAASVNPLDFKIRSGQLRLLRRYPLPIVMGNDLAGRVAAIGRDVRRVAVGDLVFARVDKERLGAFAEYTAVSEAFVAKKPTTLDFEHAAGVPLVALTAWQALHEALGITKGTRVFVPAGAGGVGGIAIQMAKLAGAIVTTTASGAGLAIARDFGADQVIDYKSEDPYDKVRDQDAAFDLLGGESLLRTFAIVKRGGKVVSIAGTPDGRIAIEMGAAFWVKWLLDLASLKIRRTAKKHGVTYQYLFMRPDGEQPAMIAARIDDGTFRTVVDRVFSIDDAKDALAYAETGRAKGKVIIRISSEQPHMP